MAFGVDIPTYHGPLDLLFYLIKRQELTLEDISLAQITDQFIAYLEVIQEFDLDDVGEFVEITSQLIELKVRWVLPENEENESTERSIPEDSMPHLVERLIQYKRFRDVASVLDEQSRRWQLRYNRLTDELVPPRIGADEIPVARVEVWDLVSAFGRILRTRQKLPQQSIQYDDTPIHIYMKRVHDCVLERGKTELQDLFDPGMHKSTLVGIFLATLELTRRHGLVASQPTLDGPVWIEPGPEFKTTLSVEQIDAPTTEAIDRLALPTNLR